MKDSRSIGRGYMRAWLRAATAPVSLAAAFVEALSARFRRRLKLPIRLDLPLASRARFHSLTVHRNVGNTVNQLKVTLQTVLRRTYNTPPSVGQNLTAPVLTLYRNAPTAQAAAPAASLASLPPSRANLLLPILARRARVESLSRAPASPLLAIQTPPGLESRRTGAPIGRPTEDLPIARVRSIPQTPLASANVTEVADPPSPLPPPVARSVPAQPLPPQEVERIAEQVIGNIDRRIIAERERLGRV